MYVALCQLQWCRHTLWISHSQLTDLLASLIIFHKIVLRYLFWLATFFLIITLLAHGLDKQGIFPFLGP